jgi:hypothetical protein
MWSKLECPRWNVIFKFQYVYGPFSQHIKKILLASWLEPYFLCCINRLISLSKNLFNLTEFLAEAFRYHVHHFQCRHVKYWTWCTWHRKASAKKSSKLNRFLLSEVNLQHIIAQDQNEQNNNRYFFYLSTNVTQQVQWR